MPQLHPPHPRIPPHLWSEQEVLRALRTLPPEAHVFTRLTILDDEKNQEREIDFLVAHPDLGLVIIEVKGSGVEPAGDHWTRRDDDGNPVRMDETPAEQMNAQQWMLDRFLKKAFGSDVPEITRVLALPALPLPDDKSLGPDLPACRILTRSKLGNAFLSLRAAVAGSESWETWKKGPRARKHRLSNTEVTRLVEIFTPGLKPPVPLSIILESEGRLQDQTALRILDHLASNLSRGRFHLQGGPGSGKSLLARQTTRIWAAGGRRVLLLAYNKAITYATQCALDDLIRSGGAVVSTYHDLAVTLLSSAGKLPVNQGNSVFFSMEVPKALAQWLSDPACPVRGQWDALVVDEAQDLDPAWIHPLLALLRHPESDPVLLLEDPAQSIFRNSRHHLGQPWTLDLSLRQHPALRWAACQSYPECGWEAEAVPDLDGVVQRIPSSPGAWKEDLNRALDGLAKEGLSPDQVIVLATHRPKTLGIQDGERLGPWGANPISDWWEEERAGQIRVGTVQAFKGLEADVVVFLEPIGRPTPESRRLAYTAYSRARYRLIVLESAIPESKRVEEPRPTAPTLPPESDNQKVSLPQIRTYREDQRQALLGALTAAHTHRPAADSIPMPGKPLHPYERRPRK